MGRRVVPIGVVSGVSPWNYPFLFTSVNAIVPALMAGMWFCSLAFLFRHLWWRNDMQAAEEGRLTLREFFRYAPLTIKYRLN